MGVCASILATLLLGHIAYVQADRGRLERHVARLLEATMAVAHESTVAINSSIRLETTRCDADDLVELRVQAFRSRVIRDIGRIQDGRLLCTAAWGVLADAPALPEPTRRAASHHFWSAGPALLDRRISTDMIAAGDTILFVAPDWFGGAAHLDARTSSVVTTRNRRHVLRAWGTDIAPTTRAAEEAWYDLGTVRGHVACDEDYDLCAIARTRGSGLIAASPQVLLGLVLLGGLAGLGINSLLGISRRRRATLQARLARALHRNRLHMAYQPLRKMSDRSLVGFEALARWTTSAGDSVPPDVFVPMAERSGLGRLLSRQIVEKVLADVAPVLREAPHLHISINVAAGDLLDPQFHACLDAQVARHGIAAGSVVLELTERSTAGRDDLVRNIGLLRERGYLFHVDDFGTGYSSLDYLASLPLDAVKIDRLFTQAAGSDSVMGRIFEPICRMAQALGVRVVVEGIENEAQAAYVARVAPEAIGQGWLFGRPGPACDLRTT